MKLALISPAQLQASGDPLRVKKSFLIPLSVYLIAGMTPRDWEIDIKNDYTDTFDYEAAYDLVAITATTLHSRRGYDIADEFRRRGKRVVFGGFHATLFPEEVAEHADSVVYGEAELVWRQVLEDAANGRLRGRYQADQLCDMQDQPVPRFDLIEKKKFVNDLIPIESTRGCPFNCEYCAVTRFYSGKYRHRPIGEVIRNIQATGSRYIAFVDDNIIGDKDYSRELFEALIPLNIRWMAQTTMTMADDYDLLDKAVRSGLRFAWTGVESVRAENLAEVKRKINQVEEFERRLGTFIKRGVLVGANIMMGFDHDTPDIYEETYQFLVRNKVFPFVYILTPIPGTALWDRMHAEGRVLHENWTRYTGFRTVFQPKNFSAEEQDERYFQLVERLFNLRNNLLRSFSQIQLDRFKEDFFIRLAAFIVGTNVGRIAKRRGPTYW